MPLGELKTGCYRGMVEVKVRKNKWPSRFLGSGEYSREVSIHYNDQPLSERESRKLFDSLDTP